MSEVGKATSTDGARARGKQPWSAPKLTRLEASDAEVGPRLIKVDGAFTSS